MPLKALKTGNSNKHLALLISPLKSNLQLKAMDNPEKHTALTMGVDTPDALEKAIENARKCLLSGGLVAYPTESFYGLAVDSRNEDAIKRIFSAKGRGSNQPILILTPSIDILEEKFFTTHPSPGLSCKSNDK